MNKLLIFTVAMSVLSPASASDREPSNGEVARQFAEALRSGGDPSLGGRVPITAEQKAKLANLSGCQFRRMPISTRDRSVFLWSCPQSREGDDYVTDIYFRDRAPVLVDIATAVRRRF